MEGKTRPVRRSARGYHGRREWCFTLKEGIFLRQPAVEKRHRRANELRKTQRRESYWQIYDKKKKRGNGNQFTIKIGFP